MQHFVAVAEELHFGRAAKRLNMAQPPLSQSIQRLEANLGLQLMERSRSGVELTAAGRVYLREARQALLHADLARKLAQREASKSQEVKVSFIGPALYRLLPRLLVSFTQANREVDVRLIEEPSPAQVEAVLRGDTDIGFITAGQDEIAGCDSLIVERSTLVAVVPAAWDLAQKPTVSLAELAEHPFILPPPQKYAAEPTHLLKLFGNSGTIPHVIQESTHANTTLGLVGAGLGFSVITGTASLNAPQNVRFLPISDLDPVPQWGLMMIWRSDHLTRTTSAFVQAVRAFVDEHPELMRFGIA